MFRVFTVFFSLLLCTIAHADLLDLSTHGDFKSIYFIPEPSARNIEVRVFVPVGEVDRTGPEGLAHYLEHLVVWSADRVHGEGLRNREVNAWTSPYWTTYWNRGPIDAFENIMRNARAVFEPIELSQEFMMTERDVVEREFDLRYSDNPTAILFREAYHHLYRQHGLGRSVMGTPESIRQITPADALAFHKERYRPQDAYLLIYGPITKEEVVAQIEKNLTNLAQPEPVERRALAPLPEQPEDSLSLSFPKLKRDKVLIVGQVVSPPKFSRRKLWFSLLLLEDIMNSAQPGGLAKTLYYDNFVVTGISTRLILLPSGDIGFEVYFSPEDGISASESLERVQKALRDLARKGLPVETVEAIRDQTRAEVRRLEKAQARHHATIAQSSILNLGQALDVKAHHYELGQPTVHDLNAIMKSIVESPFSSTAVAHPENP
ncbi:MAG: M16 family metallopeptidase [Thalassovita sp.]